MTRLLCPWLKQHHSGFFFNLFFKEAYAPPPNSPQQGLTTQARLKSAKYTPFSPPVKNTSPKSLRKLNKITHQLQKAWGFSSPERENLHLNTPWMKTKVQRPLRGLHHAKHHPQSKYKISTAYTTVTTRAGAKSPTDEEEVVSEQLWGARAIILTWKMLFAAACRFVSTHAALASWFMMLFSSTETSITVLAYCLQLSFSPTILQLFVGEVSKVFSVQLEM